MSMLRAMKQSCLQFLAVLLFVAGSTAQPVRIATSFAVPEEVEAPPTYVEIDTSALRHNVAVFKDLLEDNQLLCVVIKTDAYYVGVEHVAAAALAEGAERLCFVSNTEAWKVRQMGIGLPLIRIVPGTRDEVTRAVQIGGVEELAGSLRHAEMISQVALSFRNTQSEDFTIPIHVNINMSMTRMGIFYESDLEKISNLPGIQVEGLMSHFANAYDRDLDTATKLSMEDQSRFDRMIANFESQNLVVIHLANTAATLRWPEARRDMVRIGSGILFVGRVPAEWQGRANLWPPVVAVKSTVALVMDDVPPGSTVGYESTYRTDPDKPSRLATLRFGWGNGYPMTRNSGYVLIRGKRFPIVGGVSQNLTIVNVTDENQQDPVRMGDEVVILGPQGNDRITIEELLEWTGKQGSNGTQLLFSLMARNPRKAVEGVAAGLHPRHLTCGLCLAEKQ